MVKIKKIKLKHIKSFLKKIPVTLGENAFLSFLGLFFLSLIFAFAIFYTQYLSLKKIEPEPTTEFKFNSNTYQEVLKVWEEKEERLKKTDSKQYPNPFIY